MAATESTLDKTSGLSDSIGQVKALSDKSTTPTSLMELPAEIRVMILRELLTSKKPVHERSNYLEQGLWSKRDAKGRFRPAKMTVSGYRLNPAILAVSRLLHREGHSMLYGTNTLVLELVRDIHRPCDYDTCLKVHITAKPPVAFIRHNASNGTWQIDDDAKDFALRFNHFQLFIAYGQHGHYPRNLRNILKPLAPLMKEKAIEVRVGSQLRENIFLSPRSMTTNKQFQLLRCKGFRFATSTKPVELQSIEKLITSQQPVIDLSIHLADVQTMINTLLYMVSCKRDPNRRWGSLDLVHQEIEKLNGAVDEFDVEKFKIQHSKITKQFNKEARQLKKQAEALSQTLAETSDEDSLQEDGEQVEN